MATTDPNVQDRDFGSSGLVRRDGQRREVTPRGMLDRRRWTETKNAFKTTELLVLALAVIGVLIATWRADNLDAPRAWVLVTALAIGYMVSRGLAKLGKGTYED